MGLPHAIIDAKDMSTLIREWEKASEVSPNIHDPLHKRIRALEWLASKMTRELKLRAQFSIFPGSGSMTYFGSERSIAAIDDYCKKEKALRCAVID
jgi:hypothetical protein